MGRIKGAVSKLESGILLTAGQIKRLSKGKTLVIWREGKQLTIGSKAKSSKITRYKSLIIKYKAAIEQLEKNGHSHKAEVTKDA